MEALKVNPNLAAGYNNLGVGLMQLGRSDEGVLHFQEALRLDPDYKSALKNLENAQRSSSFQTIGCGISHVIELDWFARI